MKTELNLKSYELGQSVFYLPESAYENIFNMYLDDRKFLAFNILKSVDMPEKLDSAVFKYVLLSGSFPWTKISLEHYGTINLWWLICVTNKIMNPVILPKPGSLLKIIHPEFVSDILEQMRIQS